MTLTLTDNAPGEWSLLGFSALLGIFGLAGLGRFARRTGGGERHV